MRDVRVESLDTSCEGPKRCYLPLRIRAKCPGCGEEVIRDLNDHYLSNPRFGSVVTVDLVHEAWEEIEKGKGCKQPTDPDLGNTEWAVKMRLDVTLVPVEG